jgi:hypothetical protein
MRNILVMVAMVAATLVLSVTGFSEEKATGMPYGYGQNGDSVKSVMKDQCLIVAKNCVGADDSVLIRVERLNNEIGKGTAVYTHEELKFFQEQLNWIYYESDAFPAVRL